MRISGWRMKQMKRLWRMIQIQRDPHCDYCGVLLDIESSTIDHIIPRAGDGMDNQDNWALSCAPCNRRKSDMVLVEAGLKLRTKRCRVRKLYTRTVENEVAKMSH